MKKQTEEQIVELLLRLDNKVSRIEDIVFDMQGDIKDLKIKIEVLDHKVDNIIETLAPKLEQIEDHKHCIGRLEAAT